MQAGQRALPVHVAQQVVFAVLVHLVVGVRLLFLDVAGAVTAGDEIAVDVVRAVPEPDHAPVCDGIVQNLDVVEELRIVVLGRGELFEGAQLAGFAGERVDLGDELA